MNAVSKDTFYKQARKHAVWASVWLVLAVSAMLARPQANGIEQWLTEQAMFIAGFLMVFQFGRMFQCLANMKTLSESPAVPAWTSLEAAADETVSSDEPEPYRFHVRDIRAFASVKEATQHGWEFGDAIANFGGEPVPRVATFNGQSYAFDGLSPDHIKGSVPLDHRLFGRLSYKLVEPDPPAVISPAITMMAS